MHKYTKSLLGNTELTNHTVKCTVHYYKNNNVFNLLTFTEGTINILKIYRIITNFEGIY